MIKKIATLFLVSTLLATMPCFTYAKSKEDTKDTTGTAIFVMAIPTEIHLQKHPYKESKDYMNIDMQYPEVKGLADKKFQKTLNQYFKDHVMQLQKDIKKEAKREYDNHLADTPKYKYEVISNYSVKESLNQYLVISLFDYIYTGGAHGLPTQSYVTVDISENQILTLNQLFDNKIDYKQQIKDLIVKQIEERTDKKEKFFDDFYDLVGNAEDYNFYVNTNGDLVIVFNVYEIAPYSTGVMEFTLKKENLKGYRVDYHF